MSHYTEETYSVYDESLRRARKEHRCSACREKISAGHSYTRVAIVFDGEAETVKRCARCQAIHLHLRAKGREDGMWPDERLNCGETYRGHWGEDPPEEIAALAFAKQGERF